MAISNNVSAIRVAAASKHKDPKALAGYADLSANCLMQELLSISSAASSFASRKSLIDGV